MGPHERIRRATDHLDKVDAVPADAVQTVDALVHKIDTRIVLTEVTEQGWRDVVQAASMVDKSSAPSVANLMRTVKAAPTKPLPPKGWLSADMAVLDVAKIVVPDPS